MLVPPSNDKEMNTSMIRKNMRLAVDHFTEIAKAFSDPNRVRAFMALRKGELCVCQIIELLALAPSTVSKHMSVLKRAGLVASRKDSRWVYYRLAEWENERHPVASIIKLSIALLMNDEQIAKDDALMAAITTEDLEVICRRQRSC